MKNKKSDIITFIILSATIVFMVDFNQLGFLDYAILALGALWVSLTVIKWRRK